MKATVWAYHAMWLCKREKKLLQQLADELLVILARPGYLCFTSPLPLSPPRIPVRSGSLFSLSPLCPRPLAEGERWGHIPMFFISLPARLSLRNLERLRSTSSRREILLKASDTCCRSRISPNARGTSTNSFLDSFNVCSLGGMRGSLECSRGGRRREGVN